MPSRQQVDSYQRFRRQVEEAVGRLNGARGSLGSAPIHYLHQSVTLNQLVALYQAADVMLVTPLRDGMNLVAKEFVASRVHDDGVLLLSEFAGAAAELGGAFIVNPYDVDQVADGIEHALTMPDAERRDRMRSLRRRVIDHDVRAWGTAFSGGWHAISVDQPRRSSTRKPPLPRRCHGHARPAACASCSTTTARSCLSRSRLS